MKVEIVLFGYHDARIGSATPFGFAMLVDDTNMAVHWRTDLDRLHLPELFAFTANNLHALVGDAFSEHRTEAAQKGLHVVLVKHCFGTLGSFRCWQPVKDKVPLNQIDGYVLEMRSLIDAEMEKHLRECDEFIASSTPTWDRSPQLPRPLSMPALCSA